MSYRLVLSIAAYIVLSGCSTPLKPNEVSFTVYTEPPGAMLYEGQASWGMAPQERIYTGGIGAGIIQTTPITAIWASGARQSQTFNLPMNQGGQQATISRPMDSPGLDKDLAFAAQLQAIQAQQNSASAAQAAAYFQMMQANKSAYPTSTTCMVLGGDMLSCKSR